MKLKEIFSLQCVLALSLVVVNIMITPVIADLEGLKFYLFTKSNKKIPVEIKASNISNITNSKFASNKPVKFLCHGYTSRSTAEFPTDMKNAYLKLNTETFNIIAVGWAKLASALKGYDAAALNARKVGKEIANLMNVLISSGKSHIGDFHFIGHSLGAQVGAFISSNLGGGKKIPRITGLDPARPGFNASTTTAAQRLDPSDADFVDIIKTSAGVAQSKVPDPPGTGTIEFYANGGVSQPGCLLDLLSICSHARAYTYYQESISTKVGFKSYKCKSYEDFEKNCPKTNPALMGEYVSKKLTGTYYLNTNSDKPFAKG